MTPNDVVFIYLHIFLFCIIRLCLHCFSPFVFCWSRGYLGLAVTYEWLCLVLLDVPHIAVSDALSRIRFAISSSDRTSKNLSCKLMVCSLDSHCVRIRRGVAPPLALYLYATSDDPCGSYLLSSTCAP
uniref:Uncharacterized protein n=1 Tax=Physcomitrium patens TaxID=3218 RepID=A0A2K1KQ14_PHYPA|nr:hypothetical protein PHYPA_006738 [Physcomitrium patens]